MTKIGIVTALRAEAASLTCNKLNPMEPVHLNEQLLLVLSGMGTDRVNEATSALLSQGVEALISFGTAGALSADIKSGDILIPESIITTSGDALPVSSSWRDTTLQRLSNCPATVHGGNIAGTNTVIASSEDKHALYEKTAALAVDMESALVTAAARNHGLQTLTIRVIVDEADMAIPDSILANTDAFGQIAIPALLGTILLQPMLIKELLRLGKAFKAAGNSMRWIGMHAKLLLLPN